MTRGAASLARRSWRCATHRANGRRMRRADLASVGSTRTSPRCWRPSDRTSSTSSRPRRRTARSVVWRENTASMFFARRHWPRRSRTPRRSWVQPERAGIRLMVHDNFRFQLLASRAAAAARSGYDWAGVHAIACRTRMGDGWGADGLPRPSTILSRRCRGCSSLRPVCTSSMCSGISSAKYGQVCAALRRQNPAIVGEDAGVMVFEFQDGATGVWDASRYNESLGPDPRCTFGEFLVEGPGRPRPESGRAGTALVRTLGRHASRTRLRAPAAGVCWRLLLSGHPVFRRPPA